MLVFGAYRLDPLLRQLSGAGGERIALHSRAFDALLFMVEHPGEILGDLTLLEFSIAEPPSE